MRGLTLLAIICVSLTAGCGQKEEWRIIDTPSGLRRVNDATGEVLMQDRTGAWVPAKAGRSSSTPIDNTRD